MVSLPRFFACYNGRMAQREKWTPSADQLKQVETMSGLGLKVEQIAILLGVSKPTFDRAVRRIPALRDSIEKGREKSEGNLRQWAYESARKGNVAMQIFLLKTRCGFRETERLELTGADGGPIQTKKELSAEEAAALIGKYARLQSRLSKKT